MTALDDGVKSGVQLWRCAPGIPARTFPYVAATDGVKPGVEFVEMVAAAIGVDIHTEEGVKAFAAETGQEDRYIYRWRSGTNGVSLPNAISMLRAAKLLRPLSEVVPEPGSVQRILEGLSGAVADLTKSHREALDDLRDVRTRLEQAEAALAPAASARTRRGRAQ